MARYECTVEMNLKKIINESRKVAQALNEFADNIEQIEKKYAKVQEESKDKGKNNLEKAKEIVNTYYSSAAYGIFNSRNIVGDVMDTIYEGEGLVIDVCYGYSYFEVFGLSDVEFEELERYYDSLSRKEDKR